MSEPRLAAPAVAILMYHSIARSTTASFKDLTVDPLLFDEQVAALHDHGCQFIPVKDVPAWLTGGDPRRAGPVVAISIDDGLADAATGAATVLARHRIPGTIFIPTAYVGARARWLSGDDSNRPLMDWRTIAALAEAGLEIGSHGHRHLAADLNAPAVVRADAAYSKNLLESRLGQRITSYAYPFGYQTAAARHAVRGAGFSQACALINLPAVASDDPLALPRLHVGPETAPELLVQLVGSRPVGIARRRAEVKQRIWLAGRRWVGWGPPEARAAGFQGALRAYPEG